MLLRPVLFFIGLLFFISSDIFAVSFRARLYSQVNSKGDGPFSVMIFETKKFYQANADGYFEAEVPSFGTYTFRILRPTGMQEIKKSITLEDELVTIYTDKKEIPKGAIQVQGDKEKTVVSRYKVRYDEIQRMPGTFGEPLKGLETLPGITPNPGVGPGANSLIVRGADPDWNTYLYDDLPILYPFHWDGLTSVIHGNLIKSIDLYTGAFPANYNNALGGVIEIETVDKVEKKTGSAKMSLWNANAMYQTPIFDGKGYLAVATQVGYLDKTIGASGLVPEGIRLPRFTDSQVKFVYNINPENQLSFTFLHAKDDFAASIEAKSSDDPTSSMQALSGAKISAGQGFRTMGLRHIWTPGTKFTNRFTLINFEPFIDTNFSFGQYKSLLTAKVPYTGVRQDATWDAMKILKVEFGTEARVVSANAGGEGLRVKDPTNPSPNPYDTTNPAFEKMPLNVRRHTQYYNSYLTFKFKLGNFEFTPGARYDYIYAVKQGALGPRATISYKFDNIGKGLTLFGGSGEYARFSYFSPAYNKDSGNLDIGFEKARKSSVGAEQQLTSEWLVKAEVFKNEFYNIIIDDPYISDPIGMNPDKGQWLTKPVVRNRPRNYSNSGDGWSHGYELLIKKTNKQGSRDWFGWISYTWTQSFRNNNLYQQYEGENTVYTADEKRLLASVYKNSKETIASFDRTHVINIIYGWRVSEDWQVGGRWTYLTQRPIDPVVGDDGGQFANPANNQIFWNPKFSNNPYSAEYKNSRRLKPYHRLDIRIDKFYNYEWGYLSIYFEIINLYIRKNVDGENFDPTRPYSRTNPSPSPTFGTLEVGKTVIPFFNIGMEARF
ncbi:MAG: TonB-dependent receptor plug domain-containing protein [Leptospiraceae bacterium]|nr:TonB-dependent receptor plug domain-containing protein [Leptospiraceae bacterium]